MAASDAEPPRPSPAHRRFNSSVHVTLPAEAAVGIAGEGAYTSAPPPSAARTPTYSASPSTRQVAGPAPEDQPPPPTPAAPITTSPPPAVRGVHQSAPCPGAAR